MPPPAILRLGDSTVAAARAKPEPTRVESAAATVPSAAPAQTPAPPPELRITAPNDAQVSVDGNAIGPGNWSGTRFAAGEHLLCAAVHSIAGYFDDSAS
ncbi:MAG: hypothetical protein ACREND_12910 [Gemmatimonadaceae bacterium]